jgi:hypothetical protein
VTPPWKAGRDGQQGYDEILTKQSHAQLHKPATSNTPEKPTMKSIAATLLFCFAFSLPVDSARTGLLRNDSGQRFGAPRRASDMAADFSSLFEEDTRA